MMFYDGYGFYVCDEHVALAQSTLKADYQENHFTVTIGFTSGNPDSRNNPNSQTQIIKMRKWSQHSSPDTHSEHGKNVEGKSEPLHTLEGRWFRDKSFRKVYCSALASIIQDDHLLTKLFCWSSHCPRLLEPHKQLFLRIGAQSLC